MSPPLVLLGSGYTLTRLAVAAAAAGREVHAATRDPDRRGRLAHAGACVGSLEEALSRAPGAHVVVSLPPEAGLDERVAGGLAAAPPVRLVYLSSTGVYGAARGHVDEDTAVDSSSPTAGGRLEAEARYLAVGAVVLRIAGIYGPGRGAHLRLRTGALRLPESGGGRLSRIHVDDLGRAIQVALERGVSRSVYCVADDRPATLAQTVGWLCERLGLPLPPTLPLAQLHESLRGDRAICAARLKGLGWAPQHPDFEAGFTAVLEEESR
ncbi:Rossmann-fold NAD(P)-binding domain-containing protein [Citreicoccus inhibens]|uniref:SDR family NAD(P)-dependent oxidoreductase n=1 Tax=Citreicoccus inhibens TaxID=2849499 RepID=UPI001F2A74DC|nr:SDR family NAD(P)-dependent oxidoreductase [Citreicoccus inhibens]